MNDRGLLIVAIGAHVVALDARTGAEMWRTELPSGYGALELLVGNGMILAGGSSHLSALDYGTGRMSWSLEHPLPSTAYRLTMVIEGDQLYLAKGGEVACFSLRGALVWHAPLKKLGRGEIAMGFPGNVRQADSAR